MSAVAVIPVVVVVALFTVIVALIVVRNGRKR